jgi:hypothetical protein
MAFGLKHITKTTPLWATWTFRIVFLLVTVASMVIAADDAIPSNTQVRVLVYLKGFEALIYGLSKMFGVDIDPKVEANGEQPEQPVEQPPV